MSRVGKMPVAVPSGVDVQVSAQEITVKGAQGTLKQAANELVTVKVANGAVTFVPVDESAQANAMSGTMRAIVANMVNGVSKGFERKLNLQVGFSHPVVKDMPTGIKVECPTQTEILIKGADRQVVGQIAAEVRAIRPPEPYKGKGIRYADERVVLKETKKK